MARETMREVYFNRRMGTLAALGFASGLPNMLTARTLNVWTASVGIDLTLIGLFSFVTLPYAWKFLWAPMMDRYEPLPRWLGGERLGRRRAWLLVTQVFLIAAILVMAQAGPTSHASPLLGFAAAAVAVAFFSASQDVVADAYRTDVLSGAEVGAGASIFVSGYRLALIASGAGAVFLADFLPWRVVYGLVAIAMVLGLIATLLAPTPVTDTRPPRSLLESMREPLLEFFHRLGWRAAVVLGVVLLFKVPDYMASKMTDPMLLHLGFTKKEIAIWGMGMGLAITIPGAMIGGPLMARLGMVRALVVMGIAHIVSNAGYFVLAEVGKNIPVMVAVVAVEYFCMGLVAAGYMAFLMSVCDKRYSATQYALLTGLMGLSASLSGSAAGWLADHVGFVRFFAICMVSGLPGMLLLRWIAEPRGDADH